MNLSSDPKALTGEVPIPEGVGRTSLLIAAWRAWEAVQIDPLFIDPIANIFVPPVLEPWIETISRTSESTRHLIGYRTRYFDDWLAAELKRGVGQVVLLGAGLDTRAIRLGQASAIFFEIDQADVLGFKQAQLERHGYTARSQFVAADYVRDNWLDRLERCGLDPARETAFIWEGNTMYLPAAAIEALLTELRQRIPRARISFDYLSAELIARVAGADQLLDGFANIGAPWVTGFDGIGPLAEQAGLEVLDDRRMTDAVSPSPFRISLTGDLFRHYSVCTLGRHE